MKRVIIAGGRDFDDYDMLWRAAHRLLSNDVGHVVDVVVLCGMAPGADALGMRWAKENRVDVREYPAPWRTHGKKAGPLRNERMAEHADMLIAFWDGESPGTKHMIETAIKRGLEVHVYRYEGKV